ncbi:MAG: alanine racemase [Deltaproteobacteria bacterium]
MIRRTRVEIDLAALVANAHEVRRVVGTAVYAVVKADAYGHGSVEVAKALAAARAVDGFCTSLVEEGVALRDAGITAPILVMGPSLVGGEDEMVAARLTPVISSHEELVALAYVARAQPTPIEAHLKVDTGMGRLGIAMERAPELAVEASRNGIAIVGLMTHFANADTDDPADPSSMTRLQLARFAEAERAVKAAGAPLHVRHAANSAAALLFPESRFDFVRTGIAIYGNGHWAERGHMAMRLVTAIAQLRRIAKGDSVGYGATWTASRESRLAILPCGYADGLPRSASGHAEVAIRGKRVPLVGRISMDIAVADVTDVPDAQVADAAVLLGKAAGGVSISAAEYGAWTGLSEYEVTCGLSKRVPRLYPAPVERRA